VNGCARKNLWKGAARSLVPLAFVLGFLPFSPLEALAQVELPSVEAVHALDNQQASHQIPVSFEATVVYSRGYQRLLFVEENNAAIFILAPNIETHVPGDRVRVIGKTAPSFRPIVVASSVTFLRRGKIPVPMPATFSELIRAQFDSQLVTVHAKVRAADIITNRTPPVVRSARLELTTEDGRLEAYVDSENEAVLESLIDSEVEIRGVAAGKFDDKMEQTGVVLYVSNLAEFSRNLK